jgi:hypothetical protein
MNDAITTFDDVEFKPLRDFNRCVMLFNIREDSGEDAAIRYLARISDDDKKSMLNVYNLVKRLGVETVRREIIKAMPLPEEEEAVG